MKSKYITDGVAAIADAYTQFETSLNGDADGPLGGLRREAFDRFRALGFPTTRHEEWRFTNIQPITRTTFRTAAAVTLSTDQVAAHLEDTWRGNAARLVFANGEFRSELSSIDGLPDGVELLTLAEALKRFPDEIVTHIARYDDAEVSPFVHLNTAHLIDGVVLHVTKGTVVETPIHIVHVATASDEPTVTYPRALVVVEESAAVTLFEEFTSPEGTVSLCVPVTEVSVGDNARVRHVTAQHQSTSGYHIAASFVEVGRDATYDAVALNFGASIGRHDPSARLGRQGSHVSLDGLLLVGEGQLLDSHTMIDHAAANCTSHELYKGIVKERGHGVFNGKIIVRPDAQKIDSKQSNVNLLLADTATIDTKPQLEIFADDVKCTHGATIGRLDDPSIFYLRARGIDREAAVRMLTFAFAAEVVERIADESIRLYCMELLAERLEGEPVGERSILAG